MQCIAAEIMPTVRVPDDGIFAATMVRKENLNLIYGRNTFFLAKF